MRIAKKAGIWIAFLFVIATLYQPAAADASGPLYFPSTNSVIEGDFLKFYQSAPDPMTLFGYPITNAFVDQTGHLTQYFQRARFDLLMTEKGPTVVLAKLGWMLIDENGTPPNFLEDPFSCRLFPATGKNVCYAFLQFYDSHHGEIYFGNPISGAESRDGRIVQYFENVRMEYLKNLPEGHRVILTMLGKWALEKYEPRGSYNQPNLRDGITAPHTIDSLTARAFVRSALVSRGVEQTVFLIVQDQDRQPVVGAEASVTVLNPDGTKFTYRPLGVTGADGILKIKLTAPDLAPRQAVTLEITAELRNLKANTATWFRIWY